MNIDRQRRDRVHDTRDPFVTPLCNACLAIKFQMYLMGHSPSLDGRFRDRHNQANQAGRVRTLGMEDISDSEISERGCPIGHVDRATVTVAQQLAGPPTGIQTRAGWEATIKTLESLNLLAKPITVDDVAIFN
jgi:hypothetical protein